LIRKLKWGVNIKKVLLIVPPLSKEELFKRGASETGSLLPPLGLAYIAALLEKNGHFVEILDGIANPTSIIDIVRKTQNFDIVGLTAITTFALRMKELIDAIKKENSNVKIVVGGPHATAVPMDLINDKSINFIIVGEGEQTFLELINRIDGEDYDNIKGLLYKKKGKVCHTEPRELIKDLDILPIPARHLLSMKLYKSSEARANKQPSLSMITSRGCPFSCIFCNKNIFGRGFRYHSPEYVVKEMEILKSKYGAKDIAIWDDNFTVNKERVYKICELIIKKKLNLSWSCEARVDCVDLDLLKIMRKAGCDYIAYGIESGSEKVLKKMRKGFTKDDVRRTFSWTKEAKIGIRAYFILGMIDETTKEMEETIDFAIELEPDIASFTLWVPLPGTDAYNEVCKNNELKDPKFWEHQIVPEFNFLDKPIYVPKDIKPSELMHMHQKAYRRFYFRPKYMLKQITKIRSIEDITRLIKGFLTVVKA
jgi:radical SAM superfamily enzyme YgiQ (UPF0313 family)